MKKILLSSLFIFSFCNILFSENDSWSVKAKKYISQGQKYISNNRAEAFASLIIGGSTLYGAHLVGVEQLIYQIGKGFTYYEHYPKAVGIFTVAYWYKWFSHYKKLEEINKKLSDATINNDELSCSVWNLDQWNTAKNLANADKDALNVELKSTIKSKESKEKIKKKIADEKEQLKEWIRYTGSFSDFPEEFVKKIEESKSIEYTSSMVDPANVANKAICAANHLRHLDIKLDENSDSLLIKQEKSNYFFYSKHWLNPLTWTLAPWSGKARTLCAKLIRLYGRLSVLEDIVNKFKVQASIIEKVKDLGNTADVRISGNLGEL